MVALKPEIKFSNAHPNQQVFETPTLQLTAELGALKVVARGTDAFEEVSSVAPQFYEIVTRSLRIDRFTRAGCRIVNAKGFATQEEAMAFTALEAKEELAKQKDRWKKVGLQSGVRLESESSGLWATIRIEERKVEVKVPWEAAAYLPPYNDTKTFVVADADYYTIGVVEKDTFDVSERLTTSSKSHPPSLELPLMPNAQIYEIQDYQTSASVGTAGAASGGQRTGTLRAKFEDDASHRGSESSQPIEAAQLYPFSDQHDSTILQALALLKACNVALQRAQRVDPRDDYLSFDENLMQARAALRSLFALRKIGDGFAAVINASLWALKNRDADVVSRRQLLVLQNSLTTLWRRPLLHFDSAIPLLEEMEGAGLAIEPNEIGELFGLAEMAEGSNKDA